MGHACWASIESSSVLRVGVASGEKTKGELAKISQVSIWRNWFLDDSMQLSDLQAETRYFWIREKITGILQVNYHEPNETLTQKKSIK